MDGNENSLVVKHIIKGAMMYFRIFIFAVAVTLLLGGDSPLVAGSVPDVNNCIVYRTYDGPEIAVLFVSPDGDDDSTFDKSVLFTDPVPNPPGTGSPQTIVDGTINLIVMDGSSPPQPIANYPGEDIWLLFSQGNKASQVVTCTGMNGPFSTTSLGETGWYGPFWAGGCGKGLIHIVINGLIVPFTIPWNINSCDMNGDLIVDGRDLPVFAAAFYGYAFNPPPSTYDFCGDFFHDGAVNGIDLQKFAMHYGARCD